MDKLKVYFYPSCPREGYTNPYCLNYKQVIGKEFHLLDANNNVTRMKTATLFRYSWIADIVILNWIENTGNLKLGIIQFFFAYLSLIVIKLRRKRIVWMFHNITPHEGRSFFSNILCSYLYKNVALIISHSQEATEYARQYAKCKVAYVSHPIKALIFTPQKDLRQYDVFIWGTILPYKGVVEFLKNTINKLGDISILILGKCNDGFLSKQIEQLCNNFITFENRKADFDELATYIKKCNYTLFPYIGDSVSSSGALMDTLAMGGTPVGPNKGAFKDLSDEGICLTYNNYDELISILTTKKMKISEEKIKNFIKNNSWDEFGKTLKKLFNNI